MNNWNFTGNLGRDAELRHTAAGDTVASFSVGVKSGYGEKASTTWARCSLFGKRADALTPYLVKGQLVGVTGEVSLREWEGNDGQKRTALEVRVQDLTLLGKKDSTEAPAPAPTQPKPAAKPSSNDPFADMQDDVPF